MNIIIPAAGLATRMRPLSSNTTKSLIPINGKPIISWILEAIESQNIGIDNIFIVYKFDDIKNYIENSVNPFNSKLKMIKQHDFNYPGGVGCAIKSVFESFPEIAGTDVLIWLGDTVCTHKAFDFSNSFFVYTDCDKPENYCTVDIKDGFITEYYNKQQNSPKNALIGIYFLKNLILNADLPNKAAELELYDVIPTSGIRGYHINNDNWHDCGNLYDYYKTCSFFIEKTCRAHTKINLDTLFNTVTKSTKHHEYNEKLMSEVRWYKSCTKEQMNYVPSIISEGMIGNSYWYKMSQRPGQSLADLFLYDNIAVDTCCQILERVLNIYTNIFIPKDNYYAPINIHLGLIDEFYKNRSLKRFEHQIYKNLFNSEDMLTAKNVVLKFVEYIHDCQVWEYIFPITDESKKIHGDLHLGNILYEPFSGLITFVDPRGGYFYNGYSDGLYDIAKLYHDLYVGYYYINNNISNNLHCSDWNKKLLKGFDKLVKKYYSKTVVEAAKRLAIIQVLTCLPFHSENKAKCKRLFYTALNKSKEII